MKLEELLEHFASRDLEGALYRGSLSTAGNKLERLNRLVTARLDHVRLFDLFNADELRSVCNQLGHGPSRKSEMIEILVGTIGTSGNPVDNAVVLAGAFLEPTRDEVIRCIKEVRLNHRLVSRETDLELGVEKQLRSKFKAVARQYHVGGYFGLRIDIDIGDGRVGVEVKLASSLHAPTEVHRLIGQTIYYAHRRYNDAMIVVIGGTQEDADDHKFAELFRILKVAGIHPVHLTLI